MIGLLPNCCFISETSRMLEIHRALVERDVPVAVATHGGPHVRLLADAGVDHRVLGEGWDRERSEAFVRSVPGIGPPDQSMWSDDEIRTYVALEAAFFAERGVEVAVVGWTLTALLSTRIAGIPLVAEHAGSFVPPLLERGLLPGVDPSLVDLDLYTGGFNRVADQLGVEGVPSFPALLLGDLTLVTEVPEVLGVTAAEIESWVPAPAGRYRPGTRMRCTGPLFAHLDAPVPDYVQAFLASPGPVIYVAITSSPPDLVRHVVAALAPLGARVLVAATVHDLGDLAGPDVCVAGVLPSHEVMPQVDLAVTAGGQGSVQTAIASGCPFVGVPLQPEQHSNVAIVEGHGAARLVPLGQAGGSVLTDAARQLLGDPNARVQARRLQQLYAAVDGPGAAADAIASLLSTTAEARR